MSEKSFLETVASYIPGVAGYREREGRRETDRRLREFLAGRLDGARGRLDALRAGAADAGNLSGLDAVGRLDRTLQKATASLRYADAGYAGVFDQVKIRETELDRIYAYDTALLADGVTLADALAAAADAAALAPLVAAAERLDVKIARRREILEKPTA